MNEKEERNKRINKILLKVFAAIFFLFFAIIKILGWDKTIPCEKNDIKCIAEKNIAEASLLCPEKIEAQAKYDHLWGDNDMFKRFALKKGGQDKVITYIGDNIKLQNGFGAWQWYTYKCDLELNSMSVVGAYLIPGKID